MAVQFSAFAATLNFEAGSRGAPVGNHAEERRSREFRAIGLA